jgi:hypothetical protein
MSGIMVDMDAVVNSLWAKNNDATLTKTIGQQIGMMTSALEHRIPELFFTNEQNPGEAVSAVKALARASAQGQRIYQVTSANVNSVLPALTISQEVKEEIRNSVAVGKVVTVSQKNVTVGGWAGVGYIVSDPQTGSGAYRISGGSNGGWFIGLSVEFGMSAFLLGSIVELSATTLLLLPLLEVLTSIMIAALVYVAVLAVLSNSRLVIDCFLAGLRLGLDIAFLWVPFALQAWQQVLAATLATIDTLAFLNFSVPLQSPCFSQSKAK